MSDITGGFVVSDYTIMAIVTGLNDYGLLQFDDSDMNLTEALKMAANSLRIVNEYQIADTNTVKPKEKDEPRDYPLVAHIPVKISSRRKFTDAERMQACNAWLAQVDNGKPMDFDFLTIMETVKMLKKKMAKANYESGDWTRKWYFKKFNYFADGVNISKEQLDLAA